MDKNFMLGEIKRTAAANGGPPLGERRFHEASGITRGDWWPHHWTKFGDAQREAGLPPNKFLKNGHDRDFLLEKLCMLIRDNIRDGKRYPTQSELRAKCKADKTFPSHSVFFNKLGKKSVQIAKIREYCNAQGNYEDVLRICEDELAALSESTGEFDKGASAQSFGYVYLLKSAQGYKLGQSNDPDRRATELGTLLPEKPRLIHKFRTDDPVGIENYWKTRFVEKKIRGEWYRLSPSDVQAFKRRKSFM